MPGRPHRAMSTRPRRPRARPSPADRAGVSELRDDTVVGEARWPMACAVLAAMALTVLLPDALRVGPGWILPLLEGVLLAALVAGDPGRIDRRSRLLRSLSI